MERRIAISGSSINKAIRSLFLWNEKMLIEMTLSEVLAAYPNEHAARINNPDKYEKFRRENNKFGEGIDVIWGITKDGKTEVQAIRFDAKKFTVEEAKKWLKDHDYNPIEFVPASGKSKAKAQNINICGATDIKLGKEQTRPKISALVYNGGIIQVAGWGPIVIDLAGLQVGENVQILADHENTTDNLIGYGTVRIQNNTILLAGFLNDSEKANKIVAMHKSGQPLEASVGVEPKTTYDVSAGNEVEINGRKIKAEDSGFTVVKGTLREISILPLGADSQTAISIAAAANLNNNNFSEIKNMKILKAIFDEYAGLLDNSAKAELYDKAIEAGWKPEELRAKIIEQLQVEKLRGSRPVIGNTGIRVAQAESKQLLSAATLLHYGFGAIAAKSFDAGTLEEARKLSIRCALNLCSTALQLNGIPTPSNQNELIKAAFSTASLPQALADSQTKILLDAYQGAYQNWRPIAAIKPVKNFKEQTGIRGVMKSALFEAVGPTGELKHAELSEESFKFQADTKGKMFSISRQMIINDDLNTVFQFLRTLGISAARTIHRDFWNTLRDATEFFTIPHGNYLAGANTALDIDNLSKAIKLFREQVDADDTPIALEPKTLAVSPANEAGARQLLSSIELNRTGDNSPTGNPWADLNLGLIVEPFLAAGKKGSDKAWYLFADPNIAPAIVVSFLNGVETPTVEEGPADFNTLGQQFRAYLDFGVDTGDYRGAIKMKGEV